MRQRELVLSKEKPYEEPEKRWVAGWPFHFGVGRLAEVVPKFAKFLFSPSFPISMSGSTLLHNDRRQLVQWQPSHNGGFQSFEPQSRRALWVLHNVSPVPLEYLDSLRSL